jgi:ATP-dependent Lon protease
VPAGAIPKDGPSAGVAMVTALASEMTGRPVRGDLAMTGEITLSGRVLPVGGIKEKVLAARRVGIRHVALPWQNEKNINEDISEDLRRDITVHFVTTIDEVLDLALLPAPASPPDGPDGSSALTDASSRECQVATLPDPRASCGVR